MGSEEAGAGDIATISRAELERRLGDPTLAVVNVLPREAYDEAHIPGSIGLPLADVAAGAGAVLPDRAQEVAVHCASPT